MFEASLITLLAADSTLQSLLTTYASAPAIFSDVAPQGAETPYIVISITKYAVPNNAASGFDIDCDIFDYSASAKTLREIAERVEFVCDFAHITTDTRFGKIRLRYENGREIENSDIKLKRYLCRLSARAGRKKWCEAL